MEELYQQRLDRLKRGGRSYQRAIHLMPNIDKNWHDLASNLHIRSLPEMRSEEGKKL
jgi:stalled ribosome alternative rescue factor ArfA